MSAHTFKILLILLLTTIVTCIGYLKADNKVQQFFKTPTFGRYDTVIWSNFTSRLDSETRVVEFLDRKYNVSTIIANDENDIERAYHRYKDFSTVVCHTLKSSDPECNKLCDLPKDLYYFLRTTIYFFSHFLWKIPNSWYGPSLLIDFVNVLAEEFKFLAQLQKYGGSLNTGTAFRYSMDTVEITVILEPEIKDARSNDSIRSIMERKEGKVKVGNQTVNIFIRRVIVIKKFFWKIPGHHMKVDFQAIRELDWADFDTGFGAFATKDASNIATSVWQSPLMLPRGIGCRMNSKGLKLFNFNPTSTSRQLSTTFHSVLQDEGSYFFAYDWPAPAVRFDTPSMKRLYSLDSKELYIIRKSLSEQVERQSIDPNDKRSKSDSEGVTCTRMARSRLLPSGNDNSFFENPIKYLFGIDDDGSADFLGIEVFNGHMVEVYEIDVPVYINRDLIEEVMRDEIEPQLAKVFCVPLAFAQAQHVHQNPQGIKTMRVVYYVTAGTRRMLKMQLYGEYDSRTMIADELIFSEFAYDLTKIIPPLDDDSSSRMVGPSSIFSIAECLDSSGDQLAADFLVRLEPRRKNLDANEMRHFLRDSRSKINMGIWQQLVTDRQINSLNILDFELTPYHNKRSSTSLVTRYKLRAKFAELQQLDTFVESLGFFKVTDFLTLSATFRERLIQVHNEPSKYDCATEAVTHFDASNIPYVIFCQLPACYHVMIDASNKSSNPLGEKIEMQNKTWAAKQNFIGKPVCELLRVDEKAGRKEFDEMTNIESKLSAMSDAGYISTFFDSPNDYDTTQTITSAASKVQFDVTLEMTFVKHLHAHSTDYQLLSGWRLTTAVSQSGDDNDPTKKVLHNTNNLAVRLPDSFPNKVAFDFCQRMCQLEELCTSFSFCDNNELEQERCILSTLVINKTQVEFVEQNFAFDENQTQSQLWADAYDDKADNVVKFVAVDLLHSNSCTIHAKNVLSMYKLDAVYQISLTQFSELRYVDDVTLDDCASLCQQHELDDQETVCRQFAYCPEVARCFYSGANYEENLVRTSDQKFGASDNTAQQIICRAYTRDFKHFFATKLNNQMIGLSKGIQVVDESDINEPVDNEVDAGRTESEVSVHKPGLTFEECALDCSSISQCLMFDFCTESEVLNQSSCSIYKIRSTLAPIDDRMLKLLDIEKPFYAPENESKKVKFGLEESKHCSHHYQSTDYLDLKLLTIRSNYSLGEHKKQLFLDYQQGRIQEAIDRLADATTNPANHASSGTNSARDLLIILNFSIGMTLGALLLIFGAFGKMKDITLDATNTMRYKLFTNNNNRI